MLLRSIVTSLTTALETQARLALTREKNMGLLLRGSAGGGGVASSGPLLSGLLLVGRLAWLLKIRGRFVEEALSPSLTGSTAGVGVGIGAGNPSAHTAHDHSNGSHLSAAVNNYNSAAANNHNSGLYISEDQMRSAFEIADTNGDGMLTYAEAIDAIQVTPLPTVFLLPLSLPSSPLCLSFLNHHYPGTDGYRLRCRSHHIQITQQ